MAPRKKKQTELDLVARAFEIVANSEEGLTVLRTIFEHTGYDQDPVRQNHHTGEINQLATNYNSSKRSVWLHVRQHLSPQARARIENQEE